MQEANLTSTTSRRRRAQPPCAVSNVVTLPKRLTGTEAIVAEVSARSAATKDEITLRLREITAFVKDRHRERANSLLPIAMKMDAGMLLDFIEIGQRMLAGRAGA